MFGNDGMNDCWNFCNIASETIDPMIAFEIPCQWHGGSISCKTFTGWPENPVGMTLTSEIWRRKD